MCAIIPDKDVNINFYIYNKREIDNFCFEKMNKKISYILQSLFPSFITNFYLSIRYQCYIHPLAKIYWPRNIKFAKGVKIGRGTIITAQKHKDAIVLSKNVAIEEYCIINTHGGDIKIGENTTINAYSMIQSTIDNVISIGNNVAIAPYTRIVPNHEYDGEKRGGTVYASTKIDDNVWIGAGVTIVIGKNIGKNSIIGANSVVTRDIPNNIVAAGIPAKQIKTFEEYVQKETN